MENVYGNQISDDGFVTCLRIHSDDVRAVLEGRYPDKTFSDELIAEIRDASADEINGNDGIMSSYWEIVGMMIDQYVSEEEQDE